MKDYIETVLINDPEDIFFGKYEHTVFVDGEIKSWYTSSNKIPNELNEEYQKDVKNLLDSLINQ